MLEPERWALLSSLMWLISSPDGTLQQALQLSAKWRQRCHHGSGCAGPTCGFSLPAPGGPGAHNPRAPGLRMPVGPPDMNWLLGRLRSSSCSAEHTGTRFLPEWLCFHKMHVDQRSVQSWEKGSHLRIPDAGKELNFTEQRASGTWGKILHVLQQNFKLQYRVGEGNGNPLILA